MQAKRIQVVHNDVALSATETLFLTAPSTPREEINYHNIWASINIEPENADANAQGWWILYILNENGQVVIPSEVALNNEQSNKYIIACGSWGASNQTPFQITINPKTSRTLNPGDSLGLAINVRGITAGVASVVMSLCAHTTRK